MAVIELTDVAKSFKKQEVLRSVSLTVEAGHAYGLTGPNGSGKSILLYLMSGLTRPDSGVVRIDPRYLSGSRTFPDKFGISINGPGFLPRLSALDNLVELAAIRKTADRESLREALTDVGLDPDSPKRAGSFSMGMKQKLSLAQALIESPEVLLLDEPFNALDVESTARISALLADRLARGVTIVMTSHHKAEIDALCDTTFQLDAGRVRAAGEGEGF